MAFQNSCPFGVLRYCFFRLFAQRTARVALQPLRSFERLAGQSASVVSISDSYDGQRRDPRVSEDVGGKVQGTSLSRKRSQRRLRRRGCATSARLRTTKVSSPAAPSRRCVQRTARAPPASQFRFRCPHRATTRRARGPPPFRRPPRRPRGAPSPPLLSPAAGHGPAHDHSPAYRRGMIRNPATTGLALRRLQFTVCQFGRENSRFVFRTDRNLSSRAPKRPLRCSLLRGEGAQGAYCCGETMATVCGLQKWGVRSWIEHTARARARAGVCFARIIRTLPNASQRVRACVLSAPLALSSFLHSQAPLHSCFRANVPCLRGCGMHTRMAFVLMQEVAFAMSKRHR
jgi:hypothetical protein